MSGWNDCLKPGPSCSGRSGPLLDQPIPYLDQKGGDQALPDTYPMMGRERTDQLWTGSRRTFAAVGLAFVIALVFVDAPHASATQVPAAWPSSSLAWNNGLVLCEFSATIPSVAVSALDLNGSGLSSGISEVAEVNSTGAVVANATMTGATWTVVNVSTPDTFDLAYQAHVVLTAASGSPTPLGSADVRVDYRLAAYADSAADHLNSVAAVFQVSHWTWQGSGDRLTIALPLWPTFPSAEHLGAQTSNGLEITSSSNAMDAPREYFLLAANATATPVSGAPESVSVSPLVRVSPSFASVVLTVAPAAGNFTSLTYTATVGIPLPSTLAGLPLYDYALVGGGAATLAIVVAVGTHRVRQRPSDLQYVEEEP
jgi:hypothetical protein